MYKFKFADVGEGLHEGVVASIHVKVGDSVKDGDDLFTVETEKVTTEIAAPVDGKVAEILIKEGETIHVGDVVFVIDDGSGTKESDTKEEKVEKKEEPKEEGAASVVGEVKVSNEALPNIFGPKKTTSTQPSVERQPSKSSSIQQGVKVLSTPLARAIASEKGININSVQGTGPEGRVLKSDVLNFRQTGSVALENQQPKNYLEVPRAEFTDNKVEERVNPTPLRKAIAGVLKNSWNQVAYTNLVNEVNVTNLYNVRSQIKKYANETYGLNVTFLAYVVRAFALALKEHPKFNSIYDDKTNELVFKKYYNLGIAVDTPKGLVVPVIKHADKLTILQISKEIKDLAFKARHDKLTPADMNGGTFTITNFGSVGSLFGIPIIKYPELAIGGMGTFYDRAVVQDGKLMNNKYMNITVAADHRWIDGGDIGRFATRVKELLEKPSILTLS